MPLVNIQNNSNVHTFLVFVRESEFLLTPGGSIRKNSNARTFMLFRLNLLGKKQGKAKKAKVGRKVIGKKKKL